MLETLAIGALGVGTVMQMQATRQEGEWVGEIAETRARIEEQTAEARAEIDRQNAISARRMSVEEAGIKSERGRRLIAKQKGLAAAGNVRLNVGSPLVIEADTQALIARDIGFILESGREKERYYKSSAALELSMGGIKAATERTIGKTAKKRAKRSVWAQGIKGFGSIAYLGAESGLFRGSETGMSLEQAGPFSQAWLAGD